MSYTVYEADIKEDKARILKFWSDNHPRSLDRKYKWMYEENPAGKAKVWMIEHKESGRCVGIAALFPRKFSVRGKSFVAGVSGDFLVDQHHRSMGPAIMLQRCIISAADKRVVDFVYGFPNKKAEPIMKRVGCRILGSRTRLVKIVKTAPQLQKLRLNNFWISLLSPLLDFILRLISIETWYRGKGGFICKELNDFDERFDRLWKEEKSRFDIAGERTASILRWKFLLDPDDVNKIFAIFDSKKSVLKGYIVYCYKNNSVEIGDFVFTEDRKVILVLMTNFLRHVSRTLTPESIIISLLKNSYIIKKVKRLGFMEGKSDDNVYFYCTDKVWKELTFSGALDNWLLMQGDEDT